MILVILNWISVRKIQATEKYSAAMHQSMVPLVQPHLDWRSLLFQIVSCMSTSLQGVFISCLLCFSNPDVSTILRCSSLSLSGNNYKNSRLSLSSFAFVVVFVSAAQTSPPYSGLPQHLLLLVYVFVCTCCCLCLDYTLAVDSLPFFFLREIKCSSLFPFPFNESNLVLKLLMPRRQDVV